MVDRGRPDVDEILDAMNDWSEAKQELKQAQSEYTGYSPSYHLASWHDAEGKARGRFMSALNDYVDSRIEAKLQAED